MFLFRRYYRWRNWRDYVLMPKWMEYPKDDLRESSAQPVIFEYSLKPGFYGREYVH